MNSDWLEVHALVDDELGREDRERVQERIRACAASHAEWQAVRILRAVVKEKCVQPDCEQSWRSCCKRLDEIDRTKRVESFVGRYAWGICGIFLCVILGASWLNHANGGGLNAGDVARAESSLAPLSVPRSQTTDSKWHWLQNELDRTMPVSSSSINLLGAARGYLQDGRKIVRADLEDRDGRMKLYIIESANRVDGGSQIDGHTQYNGARINDVNCITWTGQGAAYVLAGERPVDALCSVADQISGSR